MLIDVRFFLFQIKRNLSLKEVLLAVCAQHTQYLRQTGHFHAYLWKKTKFEKDQTEELLFNHKLISFTAVNETQNHIVMGGSAGLTAVEILACLRASSMFQMQGSFNP